MTRSGGDFGGSLVWVSGWVVSEVAKVNQLTLKGKSFGSCDRLDGTSLEISVFYTTGISSVSSLVSASSLGDCSLGLLFLLNGHPVKDIFFLFLGWQGVLHMTPSHGYIGTQYILCYGPYKLFQLLFHNHIVLVGCEWYFDRCCRYSTGQLVDRSSWK